MPVDNPFPYSLDNKRYHTWNYFLRHSFGHKVFKVPLPLAATCPNRDGSKGVGGCSFCLADDSAKVYQKGSLLAHYQAAAQPLLKKWPQALPMPYFQSFSNTYVAPEILKAALEEAAALPNAVGISIATRPDCLGVPQMEVLKQQAQRTFLIVELGLQTVHDDTAQRICRGYGWQEFLQGFQKLEDAGIATCVHLINGLPGETHSMMLETSRKVAALEPHSVKFHMLHLMQGTALTRMYQQAPFPLLTREEYVQMVCDQLEQLPPQTVVQRVTGDPPRQGLVAPGWTTDKLWVRNAIDKELLRRGSMQGAHWNKKS